MHMPPTSGTIPLKKTWKCSRTFTIQSLQERKKGAPNERCFPVNMLRFFIILLLAGIFMTTADAQLTLSGKPGLLYIPTAGESEDGEFRVAYALNPAKYNIKNYGGFSENV